MGAVLARLTNTASSTSKEEPSSIWVGAGGKFHFFAKIETCSETGPASRNMFYASHEKLWWSGAISSIGGRSQPEVTKKPTPWFLLFRLEVAISPAENCVGPVCWKYSIDDRTLKWSYGSSHSLATGAMLKTHIRLILDVLVGCSRMYQVGDW